MGNCAESQTRICKAYISDCYARLASSLNGCNGVDQQILKSNIFGMLDRVKVLLGGKVAEKQPYEKPEENTDFADEAENE